jgi:translation initiation factor 2B subunit (eIF-2B alpha/beta/delta family)
MILNNCSNCISIRKNEIIGLIEYEERLKKKIILKLVDKKLLTKSELYKICYIAVSYRKCIDKIKQELKVIDNPYRYKEEYKRLLELTVNKIIEYNSKKKVLRNLHNDIYLIKEIDKNSQIKLF